MKAFTVYYLEGKNWVKLSQKEETTTIGYKRILRFDKVKTNGLRIVSMMPRVHHVLIMLQLSNIIYNYSFLSAIPRIWVCGHFVILSILRSSFSAIWALLLSVLRSLLCDNLRQIMSGENGDKSQRQTSEEIEHHIDIILLLHQSCSLVHKGREGSESSAESRGEQQFGRWRHPSPFPPVQSREEPDDEASRHIHRHRAERKRNHRAGLHQL